MAARTATAGAALPREGFRRWRGGKRGPVYRGPGLRAFLHWACRVVGTGRGFGPFCGKRSSNREDVSELDDQRREPEAVSPENAGEHPKAIRMGGSGGTRIGCTAQ